MVKDTKDLGKTKKQIMRYTLGDIIDYVNGRNESIRICSTSQNGKDPIKFICDKHKNNGVQQKSLYNMKRADHICKYCALEQRSKVQSVQEDVIKKRCESLGMRYVRKQMCDGKKPQTEAVFICPIHEEKGEQKALWYHFNKAQYGCRFCSGKDKTTTEFINEISLINPSITITGDYCGSESHMSCECKKCGHKWFPIARSLRNGNGCPKCRESKGEKIVADFLDDLSIKYEREKMFDDCRYKRKLKFDQQLPDYGIAIEVDGEQHSHPVRFGGMIEENALKQYNENVLRDSIKDQYCLSHDIVLIRIPKDRDINKFKDLLNHNLSFLVSSETAGHDR